MLQPEALQRVLLIERLIQTPAQLPPHRSNPATLLYLVCGTKLVVGEGPRGLPEPEALGDDLPDPLPEPSVHRGGQAADEGLGHWVGLGTSEILASMRIRSMGHLQFICARTELCPNPSGRPTIN